VLARAVALDGSIAVAHNGLGVLARLSLRYPDAEAHFIDAIQADPHDTAALCNMAALMKDTGRGDEAAALMAPAIDLLPNDVGVQWVGALMSNYASDLPQEHALDRHQRFGAAVKMASGRGLGRPPATCPTGLVRIGFLSPDMRRHSVAFFLLPLIKSIDRERFHISCYSLCGQPDEMTPRFQAAADAWCDASAMSDAQLVERMRNDKVEILVECAGLFSGGRPGVLARRAAPIQITWLGYPNTTGLEQVDYRIVDAVTDPPGAERYAVEQLERIADCFVCYQPIDVPPPISHHNESSMPIHFGSFNAFSKINGRLLDMWAQLLQQVPRARLVLKTEVLSSNDVQEWTREEFVSRGIDPHRLDLIGYIESQAQHRAMYNRVDIALDTFPYCGTTTTCEALIMGVPVVTLCGQTHASRVGASLLKAAGREQWVAATPGEYITIAKTLASDRERLGQLRLTLGADTLSSPLCDVSGYTRRFETLLAAILKREC